MASLPEEHPPEQKAVVTSRDEILPQGLGHGMGAIAHAEFDLDLLEMAANRLFTDPECLGHFAVLGPSGDQAQDGDLGAKAPASGQALLSGVWTALQHEDQIERGPGPELGDYLKMAIRYLPADGGARAMGPGPGRRERRYRSRRVIGMVVIGGRCS